MIANIEPTATKASAPIYHLKVVLNETKPIIWRRLQVPGNANLGWLHAVMQVALGWTNKALFNWRDDMAESDAQRLWSAPAERSGDGALAGPATGSLSPKAKAASVPPQSKSFDFETLCKSFIAPRRVLRVLTDFILFTRKDDELSKVVLRPHQMRGVERCVGRARDKKKKRGLVWHT
jgi:hypothetical protein